MSRTNIRGSVMLSLAGALVSSAGAARALAQGAGVANVTFQWTDRAGGVHPLGFAYSYNNTYDTSLSSGNTSSPNFYLPQTGVGVYTGSTINPLNTSINFFGSVQTSFGIGTDPGSTEWFRVGPADNTNYFASWGPFKTNDPPGFGNFTFTQDNNTVGATFGIGQAIRFARNYAVNGLGSAALPLLFVNYQSSNTSGSFYTNNHLTLDFNSGWCSWDVIMHEFGHFVADKNGLTASPGGVHTFGGDNIRGTGRPAGAGNVPPAGTGIGADQGSKLAWGEAFATYFELSAIKSGNLNTAISGLPAADVDTKYAQYTSTGTRAQDPAALVFNVDAEVPNGQFGAASSGGASNFTVSRRGEGDEYSVLLAMWDMYDDTNEAHTHAAYHAKTQQWCRDRVNYGDTAAWTRLIKANGGAKTFRDYWNNLTADMGTATGRSKVSGLATAQKDEAVAALGENLEAAGIADVPVTPDGNAMLMTHRPEFDWQEQNNSNSAIFRVLVFSNDWSSLVYGSPLLFDTDPNNLQLFAYTPTVDIPFGTYWWVIANSPATATQADVTGDANRYAFYWSGARQFTLVIPAPGAVALLGIGGLILSRRRR